MSPFVRILPFEMGASRGIPVGIWEIRVLFMVLFQLAAFAFVNGISPSQVAVTYTPRGGLGNQIEYMVAAISLARQNGFTFVPQTLPVRGHCGFEEPAWKYWDLREMSKALPNFRAEMPQGCNGKIDLVLKHRPHHQTIAPYMPCPGHTAYKVAMRKKFNASKIISTWSSDRSTLGTEELGQIIAKQANLIARKSAWDGRPVCVMLDNYARRSRESVQNPQLEFRHLQPTPTIRDHASEWNLDALLVVHLRAFEVHCSSSDSPKKLSRDHLCLRYAKHGGRPPVKFVPVRDVARALKDTAIVTNCTSVYLTQSPHMFPEVRQRLSDELRRIGMDVTRPATEIRLEEESVPHEHQSVYTNFVEREIASRARTFVGEIGSSWTGTICRRREAMNLKPVMWTRGLETCDERGNGCTRLLHEVGRCERP